MVEKRELAEACIPINITTIESLLSGLQDRRYSIFIAVYAIISSLLS